MVCDYMKLQLAGKPYPRTCPTCGLGPCKYPEPKMTGPAKPTIDEFPLTDEFIADIESGNVCDAECEAAAKYLRHYKRITEAAGRPEPVAHSDDAAVDRFAAAMKAKMAKKRTEGRSGWDDPEQCTIDYLTRLFHDHVRKGDPVDIGNFAMMLWHRISATSLPARYRRIPAPPSGVREGMLRAAEICSRLDLDFQDGKCDPSPSDCAEAITRAAEQVNAEGQVAENRGDHGLTGGEPVPSAPTPQPADGVVVVPSKMTLMNAAFALECPEEVPKEKRMAIAQKLLAAAKEPR